MFGRGRQARSGRQLLHGGVSDSPPGAAAGAAWPRGHSPEEGAVWGMWGPVGPGGWCIECSTLYTFSSKFLDQCIYQSYIPIIETLQKGF